MQAYKKSKRFDLSRRVLEELTANAVAEHRFKDAAYYYWMLSKETENFETISEEQSKNKSIDSKSNENDSEINVSTTNLDFKEKQLEKQTSMQVEYEHKADLYFAYSSIQSYVTDPFTSQQPEMLFQVSRFIINSLGSSELIPRGISKASTLYTLARQAMVLGAYKLARHAYDRLSKLQIPDRKVEEIEIDMLLVQAKPVRDDPDHLPVCYRCSSTNPLLNPFTNKFAKGDVCTNCGHPFVRSFINFDILPLVEFVPEPSISDEEAIEYIRQPISNKNVQNDTYGDKFVDNKKKGWKENKNIGGAETLTFVGNDDDENNGYKSKKNNKNRFDNNDQNEALEMNAEAIESDLFTRCVNATLEKQVCLHNEC
jgi:intraflagellar transport protein 122